MQAGRKIPLGLKKQKLTNSKVVAKISAKPGTKVVAKTNKQSNELEKVGLQKKVTVISEQDADQSMNSESFENDSLNSLCDTDALKISADSSTSSQDICSSTDITADTILL